MIVKYSAFVVPHGGEGYNNCQDRFLISQDTCSFGVADGVSQSFSPSTWAEIVCKNYVTNPEKFISAGESKWENQDKACLEFESKIVQEQQELSDNQKFLLEVQKEKYDYAACTFVGLHIRHNNWKAICIGDSFLVACNNEHIIEVIPNVKYGGFDNFPDYLSSNGRNNGGIRVEEHNYDSVTSFFIMTDSLAEWLLTGSEEKKISQLMNINNHNDFVAFVDKERNAHRLKDDDTTLVKIYIEKDSAEQIIFIPDAIDDINSLKKDEIPFEIVNSPVKEKPKYIAHEPEVKSNGGDTILQEAQNLCSKYKKEGITSLSESDIDSAMTILDKLVLRLKYSNSPHSYHTSEQIKRLTEDNYKLRDRIKELTTKKKSSGKK